MDTTTDRDVAAVMCDGTVLRADVRRPATGAGPWPVLLARTPYGKDDALRRTVDRAARHGRVAGLLRARPRDPVPARGGALLLTDAYPAGPFDQRDIEARHDVLTWTGRALTASLEVAGRMTAVLTTTSDGPAAWVARLCDVHPDGTSINLADGVARTDGSADTDPQDVRIDLWSAAHVFRPGRRIRLQVTAFAHPRWEAPDSPGTRRIHHAAARPSRLLLPVAE
ncbi:CocE/NonD family hydrolase [Actinacidiphila glaucinigra]|uniref:CocE/NonD family hydrolase n=1 Tax=Actinacidiphila glaucinigra TaxID=235986 RepID=UPI0035D9112C